MFFLYFVKVFFSFVCLLDREEVQCGHSNKKIIRKKWNKTYMGRFLRENDALALISAYRRIGMGVALVLAYYILAVAIRALAIWAVVIWALPVWAFGILAVAIQWVAI